MKILIALIFGVVQGAGEFLPISSSAHLVLIRDFLGFGKDIITPNIALTFDIALHFGTLLAVLIVFFKELVDILKKGLTKPKREGKIFWYLVIATIPAGIAGIFLDDYIEEVFRTNFIAIGFFLIIMGIILYFFDKGSSDSFGIDEMTLKDAILIGLSQTLAIFPGFSRSGTTISTARLLGMKREDSAKFSFFLSIPVILGAVLLSLMKKGSWALISENVVIFSVGFLTSFVVGILVIKWLLKYLKTKSYEVFMWYRFIIGMSVILVSLFQL